VQQSQDNCNYMVDKLEKGPTVMCVKLAQINLKKSYQKLDKSKIKNRAHVKCFECSTMGHFSSKCPNKKDDQAMLSRRQGSLSQRRCFACNEKGHKIVACPKEETTKQICQNLRVQFDKPNDSVSAENFRTTR
jgi:hypothetical protein